MLEGIKPQGEGSSNSFHYWGAVMLGFLGSDLLWLTLGRGRIVHVVWMMIAGLLIVAMQPSERVET